MTKEKDHHEVCLDHNIDRELPECICNKEKEINEAIWERDGTVYIDPLKLNIELKEALNKCRVEKEQLEATLRCEKDLCKKYKDPWGRLLNIFNLESIDDSIIEAQRIKSTLNRIKKGIDEITNLMSCRTEDITYFYRWIVEYLPDIREDLIGQEGVKELLEDKQ